MVDQLLEFAKLEQHGQSQPEQGQIDLSVTSNSAKVDIEVTDTGIGIAPSDHLAVFERFNRATHDHGEAIVGAGIGLALVKELIEANLGQITLDSQLGHGSTFTITLPVASGEPSRRAAHHYPWDPS